ncbi:MAG: mycothione reductase [Dermabacter sp.]|nr:mycothione reductase [Dermabacter sp.]
MTAPAEHFDIVLIGSGSGNSLPGPEFADRSIAYIDRGVGPLPSFGGTCLNVGCIPTKMFVHTADVAMSAAHAAPFDVEARLEGVDFPAVRDRIFHRIDPIARAGEDYRENHADNANLTYIHGTARFTAPKRIEVSTEHGTRTITGDTFVLAAGSRPAMPPIPGLDEVQPYTSDTIMRIPQLPASLAILGSGVIALEFAHILESFGVQVHLIARSDTLLRAFDQDIARRATQVARERYTVHLTTRIARASRADGGVTLEWESDGDQRAITVDEVLVATGRVPNSDVLGAADGGLGIDEAGRVRVDSYQRVLDPEGQVLEGMWSIGDLSSPHQLKHVANHQLRIARHNILHPGDMRVSDDIPIPAGVFTHPQIATVGMTEAEARAWAEANGRTIRVAHQEYSSIAYGWAMEEVSPGNFAKVIVDDAGMILGAHIIGPQAPTLIQILIQAMSLGTPAAEVARGQYWIHPAMPELIENALLQVSGPAN